MPIITPKALTLTSLLLATVASPALAQNTATPNANNAATNARTVTTTTPANLKDDAYVTINGTVEKISEGDAFTLRYAGGTIGVDTNDTWPFLFNNDSTDLLRVGDKVTVIGQVDDNFFTRKEVDASSIRVKGANASRFYENTQNGNNSYGNDYSWDETMDEDNVRLTGTVMRLVDDETLELSYGTGTIRVDTEDLNRDTQNWLQVGDIITVYGEMDNNWFGKKELEANYLVRTSSYRSRG